MDKATVSATLLLCALASGCKTSPQTLLLETVCLSQFGFGGVEPGEACTLTGDAQQTTGMTGDSIGFRLGPKTGALHIRLGAIQAIHDPTWSFDVIAASSRSEGSALFIQLTWGSCSSDCPADPSDLEAALDDSYAAVVILENAQGVQLTTSGSVPADAIVTFRGADIDIVDIRTPGFSPDDSSFF